MPEYKWKYCPLVSHGLVGVMFTRFVHFMIALTAVIMHGGISPGSQTTTETTNRSVSSGGTTNQRNTGNGKKARQG